MNGNSTLTAPPPATAQASCANSGGLRLLCGILAGGAVVRALLIFALHGQPLYVSDERDYNILAVNLVERSEFAIVPGERTSIRPPLYPALVAATYAVFGVENYTAVRVVQAALGLILTAVIYRLGGRMFSQPVAVLAAAAVCFYPSLLGFGNLILTELPFALLVALACLSLASYLHRRDLADKKTPGAFGSMIDLVMIGVWLGLGALTRSILWLFPPFLFLYLWAASAGRPLTRRLAIAITPVVVFAAVLSPWVVRNTKLHKALTFVDVMGGRNFMMGNYEHTPLFRSWDAISIQGEKSWHRILDRENPGYGKLTQGQKDKLAMKRGLSFVMAHPGLFIQRSLVKCVQFWQLDQTLAAGASRGWWGNPPRAVVLLIAAATAGAYAAALMLGLFGLFVAPSADARMQWFVVLLIAFVWAVHSVVFAHGRYNLPLMPLILIYAAQAVVNWKAIWERRRGPRFVTAVLLIGLLASSWVAQFAVMEQNKLRQLIGQASPAGRPIVNNPQRG